VTDGNADMIQFVLQTDREVMDIGLEVETFDCAGGLSLAAGGLSLAEVTLATLNRNDSDELIQLHEAAQRGAQAWVDNSVSH